MNKIYLVKWNNCEEYAEDYMEGVDSVWSTLEEAINAANERSKDIEYAEREFEVYEVPFGTRIDNFEFKYRVKNIYTWEDYLNNIED